MTATVRHVTIDSADPYRLAVFWGQVLGSAPTDDDHPGDPEVLVETAGVALLFVLVEDAKQVKNRVHLDLRPDDRTRDAEVERLLDLGATVVGDHRRTDGAGWVTLADIEDNEFCVERSAVERSRLDGVDA